MDELKSIVLIQEKNPQSKSPPQKTKMKITIAIPTYNRCVRLRKCLLDLLREIQFSTNKNDVGVFVSNNGSTDQTDNVIEGCSKLFEELRVPFSSGGFTENQGFDANVLYCYKESCGEYVWFVGDDDNIFPGSIDFIIENIECYKPSVIYYNHDQHPYTKKNPYISTTEYFDRIGISNLKSIKKIIEYPKLASIVAKRCESGLRFSHFSGGFAHIGLAVNIALIDGGVLHSSAFIAHPDPDYKDHINFVPHISNNLNDLIELILLDVRMPHLGENLKLAYLDPLAASLNMLGAFYRGQHTLTPELRDELWMTVSQEIKNIASKNWWNWQLTREVVKFPISYLIHVSYMFLKWKKLSKLRDSL
jgi:glycosyltransferase involved in cell wall biosynthesis